MSLNYSKLAVVPSVAWDFLFDKDINLTYLTYRDEVVFLKTFFRNYQVILSNLSPNFTKMT